MLDKETVKRVATLARLQLSEGEVAQLEQQLSVILQAFEEIAAVNTDGVVPLVTPSEMALVLREDQATPTVGVEEILKNAPERSGHLFRVPPVVG